MNEKKYTKKIELQQKMISRQSKRIEDLEFQVEALKLECAKKDELINSIEPLRDELIQNIKDTSGYKKEYKELVQEVRKMKEVLNREVFKGKWKLVKFLIK